MRGLGVAAAVAAALLVVGAQPSLAIEGGEVPAASSDFSYVGRLTSVRQVANGEVGERCGAVLVAPAWAVTARHCVQYDAPAPGNFTPENVTITFGSRRADGAGGYRATVAEIVRGTEDIALLRLTGNAPVTPVRLADTAPPAGARAIALGWGRGTGAVPLEAADMKVASADSLLVTVPDARGAHPGSAYHGDSGGPLLVRTSDGGYTLAGIARSSIGSGNANAWVRTDAGSPTRYWLDEHLPAPAQAAPPPLAMAVKVDGLGW